MRFILVLSGLLFLGCALQKKQVIDQNPNRVERRELTSRIIDTSKMMIKETAKFNHFNFTLWIEKRVFKPSDTVFLTTQLEYKGLKKKLPISYSSDIFVFEVVHDSMNFTIPYVFILPMIMGSIHNHKAYYYQNMLGIPDYYSIIIPKSVETLGGYLPGPLPKGKYSIRGICKISGLTIKTNFLEIEIRDEL